MQIKQLPNLCTLLSLAFGFAAIESLLSGQLSWAVRHLLLALACDLVAGRLAILMNARSPLGAELDSIAALATQALIPMALLYLAGLNQLGVLGLCLACLGVVAAAFRLARVNPGAENREYRGMPVAGFGLATVLLAASGLTVSGLEPKAMALGLAVLVVLMHNSWGYLRMPQAPIIALPTTLLLLLAATGDEAIRALLLTLTAIYAVLGHLPKLKQMGILQPAASPEEKTA
jgi:CDP-diacylglycerol--serine O-phosphatidyltransferase